MDLSKAIITEHAADQLARRGLALEEVREVVAEPQEVLPVREGRVVAQSVVGKHLLRVFVDVDRSPMEIVTAYKTSKIGKYRVQP